MAVERSHSTGDSAANVEDNSRTPKGFVLQLFSSVLMEVTPSLEALVVPAVFFFYRWDVSPGYVGALCW